MDRVVFNLWEVLLKMYCWYVGLGIGNFGKFCVVELDMKLFMEI